MRDVNDAVRAVLSQLHLSDHFKNTARGWNYKDVYDAWKNGTGLDVVRFPDGVHGLNDNGYKAINSDDPGVRQRVAAVHEYLHDKPGDESDIDELFHQELHHLSMVLAEHVFPALSKGKGDHSIMARVPLTDAEAAVGRKIFNANQVRREAPGVGLKGYYDSKRPAELAAIVDERKWGGWLMDKIRAAYEAQSFYVPILNVIRATPKFDIGGFRGDSWETFWNPGIQSLLSLPSNTVKGDDKEPLVAATVTTCTLSPLVASIGLVCCYTDSEVSGRNDPMRVKHFQAGGTSMPYVVHYRQGPVIWAILHVENNRGQGVVKARSDLNLVLDADEGRAGSVMFIESINLREIQG